MMTKKKPKNVAPTPSDQRKITQFFSKSTTDPQQQQENEAPPRSRSKKIARRQIMFSGPVEVVDLVDSDQEQSCLSSSLSIPPVQPPPLTSSSSSNTFNDEELPVIPKVENGLVEVVVQDEPPEELEISVDPLAYGIRIVDFNKILEDGQSMEAVNDGESAGPSSSSASSSSSSSMIQLLSTPTKAKPFASPSRKLPSPKKSPKSKVNHFSPIRHLNNNRRSRSVSKTPTKGPSSSSNAQKSPWKNSPLKSLWTPKSDPYYLRNFLTVLKSVVGNDHNTHLLNEEDHEIIKTFHCLTQSSKCLYVRLLNRKKWQRVDYVKYPQIAEDLNPCFEELHAKNFLTALADDKMELEEVLELANQEQTAELCKKLNVATSDKSKGKEKCISALLHAAKTQNTLSGSHLSDVIYKLAVKAIGPTYKISDSSQNLFARIFILFSPPRYWDSEADKGANQLLALLLSEQGLMNFPTYNVKRSKQIYRTRDDLKSFQEAWSLHSSVDGYTEGKQWDEVIHVANDAMSKLKLLLEVETETIEFDKNLPSFLRVYVAGSVLTRVCWLGVEGYQKIRDYKSANEYLSVLLDQDIYLQHYHGRWHERLVLNSKHLKAPPSKLRDLIKAAFTDKYTTDCHKLDLSTRLEKLKCDTPVKKKPKKKKKKKPPPKKKPLRRSTRNSKKMDEDEEDWCPSEVDSSESEESEVESAEIFRPEGDFKIKHQLIERTIEGEKMPTFDRQYGKSVMKDGNSSDGNVRLSSVEQFAIKYYSNEGYVFGVHGEGAVPCTIYGLLFWDVIYCDEIPDVFLSAYQPFPLDIFFDDFRRQREPLIDEMLLNLRCNWSLSDALNLMEKNWNNNHNKVSIVSWNVFPSFEQVKTLVTSMGLQVVAGICDRLAQNYRYYHSGFPDLTMWNLKKYLFAEVKGPGDTLSAKQRHWIDYLKSLGADVELCSIKAVSNKRIRTS